jgi:hypothetical protein
MFPQSIFKKMPPGTPRNRIRDFSWATLLVVKGFPKFSFCLNLSTLNFLRLIASFSFTTLL